MQVDRNMPALKFYHDFSAGMDANYAQLLYFGDAIEAVFSFTI
jgi:hypothetical protein